MDINSRSKSYLIKIHKLLNTNFDRAFGLDISDSSIELVELSKLFRFSVENSGRIELPDGVIFEGKIKNEQALVEKIKSLLLNVKPRKVSTNKVILSLPEPQIFTHHFIMQSELRGDPLRLVVQKEILKYVPVNPARMYWDIRTRDLPNGNVSIVFLGILKEVIEPYIKACNTVGLQVVSLTPQALSVARLLVTDSAVPTMIVDIGTHVTNISVVHGTNDLDLAVSFPIGGEQMTKQIAQGLNIDVIEAEKKKKSLGSSQSDEISFLIEPVVKEIAEEVLRTIQYYESKFNEKIAKIKLVGGAGVPFGVAETLSTVTSKVVEPAEHFGNFEDTSVLRMGKMDPKALPMLYSSVIGLGMLGSSNEFEDFNLLKLVPSHIVNDVRRTELFNLGYISKFTAFRIALNSRVVLAVSLGICVLSFVFIGFELYQYRSGNINSVPTNQYDRDTISQAAQDGSITLSSFENASSTNATSSVDTE